jgi:hypothetical protein
MSNKFDRLTEIFFRVQNNEATEAEEQELRQWVQSPENDEWRKQSFDLEYMLTQIGEQERGIPNMEKIWKKIDEST